MVTKTNNDKRLAVKRTVEYRKSIGKEDSDTDNLKLKKSRKPAKEKLRRDYPHTNPTATNSTATSIAIRHLKKVSVSKTL